MIAGECEPNHQVAMNCLCSVEYSFQSSFLPEDSIGSATDLQLKMLLDMPLPEPFFLPESEKSTSLPESKYNQSVNTEKSHNTPQEQAEMMMEKTGASPKIPNASPDSSSFPEAPAPSPESVVLSLGMHDTNATPSNSPPMAVVPQALPPSPQGTSGETSLVVSVLGADVSPPAVAVQHRRQGNGRSHDAEVSRHSSRRRSVIKRKLRSFQHAKSNMEVLAVL